MRVRVRMRIKRMRIRRRARKNLDDAVGGNGDEVTRGAGGERGGVVVGVGALALKRDERDGLPGDVGPALLVEAEAVAGDLGQRRHAPATEVHAVERQP
eukprot:2193139-Rhodomonas_salina.1